MGIRRQDLPYFNWVERGGFPIYIHPIFHPLKSSQKGAGVFLTAPLAAFHIYKAVLKFISYSPATELY